MAGRILAFFRHVHGILEPHHGEEGERRCRDHRPEHAVAYGLEVHDLRHVPLAEPDRPQADDDDDQQAGQLDHGQDDIRTLLADAAGIDRRDCRHEHEPDDRDADGRVVETEGMRHVGGEGARRG